MADAMRQQPNKRGLKANDHRGLGRLPAGEFPWDGVDALVAKTRQARPFLGEAHARRLVRAYGTRVERVLGPARSLQDLGPWLGTDLTGAEVRHLMEREWAQTEEDVLWRRTKLGLRFSPEERQRLATFMAGMVGRDGA